MGHTRRNHKNGTGGGRVQHDVRGQGAANSYEASQSDEHIAASREEAAVMTGCAGHLLRGGADGSYAGVEASFHFLFFLQDPQGFSQVLRDLLLVAGRRCP